MRKAFLTFGLVLLLAGPSVGADGGANPIESSEGIVIRERFGLAPQIYGEAPGDRKVRGNDQREYVARADGGWAYDFESLDGGTLTILRLPIAGPTPYLVNLADAGWLSVTVLADGGESRQPAPTPPGY